MTNNQSDVERAQQVKIAGEIINAHGGRHYTPEQIERFYSLSELMVDIASGKFICTTCKKEFQIYAISADQ